MATLWPRDQLLPSSVLPRHLRTLDPSAVRTKEKLFRELASCFRSIPAGLAWFEIRFSWWMFRKYIFQCCTDASPEPPPPPPPPQGALSQNWHQLSLRWQRPQSRQIKARTKAGYSAVTAQGQQLRLLQVSCSLGGSQGHVAGGVKVVWVHL